MTTRLIGRERERQLIAGLLRRGGPGGPEVVLVEGAPGSGKTRLAEAVVADAEAAGVPVLREAGEPVDTGGSGWFRGMVVLDDPPWARRRIESEVEAMTRGGRVLVVLTRRGGTAAAGPYPVDVSRVLRIGLGPLAPAAVGELLGELLGAAADDELRALAGVAAGLPGAVGDLVRGLREEGLIVVEGRRAVLRARRLPGRVQARVDQQVRQLSAPARHLLRVASTLGAEFRVDELASLLAEPPASLLPAIDEVFAAGLLTGGDEMLAFGHELVRAAVAETIPRPVLHALRREQAVLGPRPSHRRPMDKRPAEKRVSAELAALSERELLIARLVAGAMTNQQIAHRIERSPHTVNYHLRQIFRKLGITSRVELASRLREGAGPRR